MKSSPLPGGPTAGSARWESGGFHPASRDGALMRAHQIAGRCWTPYLGLESVRHGCRRSLISSLSSPCTPTFPIIRLIDSGWSKHLMTDGGHPFPDLESVLDADRPVGQLGGVGRYRLWRTTRGPPRGPARQSRSRRPDGDRRSARAHPRGDRQRPSAPQSFGPGISRQRSRVSTSRR